MLIQSGDNYPIKVGRLISLAVIVLSILIIILLPSAIASGDGDSVICSARATFVLNLTVSNITTSSATISWETSLDSTSQVFYDTEFHEELTDYRYSTEEDPSLIKEHVVDLTGLYPSTWYHFRIKSTTESMTVISANYTFKTLPTSGGGGGGGGGTSNYYLKINLLGEISKWRITYRGRLLEAVSITSVDNPITLCLPEDTYCQNEDKERLREITIDTVGSPPQLPDGYVFLSNVYRLSPDVAAFNPPISLTFRYDGEALPKGITAEDLNIACCQDDSWIPADSVLDTGAQTITVDISHFSLYAVIAKLPALPEQGPPGFIVSSLSINPATVGPGEVVAITVEVSNTSGMTGSFKTSLYIEGVLEDSREISLSPGSSEIISFSVTRDSPGTYAVNVNGLTGSFTVDEGAGPISEPVNWFLVGVIIAAIVAAVYIFLLLRRHSKATG